MTIRKVCLVTCYKDPNYIRVKTIESGLLVAKVDLSIIRNKHKGIQRYPEVILKLIKSRFTTKPDVYLITFRGYEILPFVLLIGLGKKVIFDEFINLIEWLSYEHKKIKQGSMLYKIVYFIYRFMLKSTDRIISDTDSHAKFSSELMNIPLDKYLPIPVSTDEAIFTPVAKRKKAPEKMQVFYYGSMLPLHGLQYVIDAAIKLKDLKDLEFLLIGGGDSTYVQVNKAIKKGANINYKKWVPFIDLPNIIRDTDVCLGGPFGSTIQSKFVVTGKTYQFLRMGKTVIVGENEESGIFTDKKDSMIVKQADSSALGNAIRWLYDNRSKLDQIGHAGAKLYDNKLSNVAVSKRITTLINEVI
ncbi:MAG TPA: glycosyltransferase [Candidatus Saccharibacteria bacterium]|nr:glycosyltransferase [Candidatus Saccharibacteria bacterium]HRQ97731.1 glycosyltransferase [Candidatus Saccharibacteria bacterium]